MDLAAYDEMRELEDHHWWFKSRRKSVAPLLEAAFERLAAESANGSGPAAEDPLGTGQILLEVGCGTGGNLTFVTGRFPRARCIGLDIEPRALDHCRTRSLDADFVCADGTRLPFADASVDCVLALDVLEHFDDDVALLAEFRRVLRPGGQLVASVPRHPALWSPHDDFLHHKRRYVSGELEGRLDAGGFATPDRYGFTLLLLPPIAAVRWVKTARARRRGPENPAGTDFFEVPAPVQWALETLYAAERLLQRALRLPWGVTLLVRAEKRA